MRPRRSADWIKDLNERHGLETEVAGVLGNHPAVAAVSVATDSMTKLDYTATLGSGTEVTIELKTKRSRYGSSWDQQDLGDNLIIIDELTIRHLIDAAPHAYLLVGDLTQNVRWYVYSIGDLLVADRRRVARPVGIGGVMKGKFVYSLDDAPVAERNLGDAIDGLDLLTRTVNACWHNIAPWPQRRSTAA
jgi:hypothetical protein